MLDVNISEQQIIEQTRRWVETLIVGHNICPFARKEMLGNTIRYSVVADKKRRLVLQALIDECRQLDEQPAIETTLMILPVGFNAFYDYLDVVDLAQQLLHDQGYEGVYQLATFHPEYCFDGEADNDAANFTNRSPYPTLHILREASLEAALARYKDPESIPERNIQFARDKGRVFFINLLSECEAFAHAEVSSSSKRK